MPYGFRRKNNFTFAILQIMDIARRAPGGAGLTYHAYRSRTARAIEEIFQNNKADLNSIIDISHKIKDGIQSMAPFIEQNTSVICPLCRHTCCTNRHECYNCDDLIYISALGLKTQAYENRDNVEQCTFLTHRGCRLERFARPSVCNWYFCNPLYDHMAKTPCREYDDFDDSFQEVIDLWKKLITEFLGKFKEIKGYDMQIVDLMHTSQRKAMILT